MSPAIRGLRRAELITSDPMASLLFHEALLGWILLPTETGFGCWVGNRRCATIIPGKAGEPAAWRPVFAGASEDGSLTGPDEATAEVAKGRAQHGPSAPSPRAGEPCWVELCSESAERADEFWTDTLNWTVRGEPDVIYSVRDRPIATRTSQRLIDGRCGWLCYFAVSDVDATAGRVPELGGRVVERIKHPVLGESLVVADPAGGIYGLAPETGAWGSADQQ